MPQPADAVRFAYLDALGIDAWRLRGAGAVAEPEAVPTEAAELADAPGDELPDDWDGLRQQVAVCTRCVLHESRTQTVFGVGNASADWMIIGEAPGAEEDRRGEPFVGRAGKLLDEILRSIGLDRQTAFIANILKCRPPNNRDPRPEEARSCRGYLDRQIELVSPSIILAVGRVAAQQLLASDLPVGRLRGQVHHLGTRRIPTIVTYHPAYLLRSPAQKRKVWDDLCLARRVVAG